MVGKKKKTESQWSSGHLKGERNKLRGENGNNEKKERRQEQKKAEEGKSRSGQKRRGGGRKGSRRGEDEC